MKINHINGYNINYTSNNQQIAPRSKEQMLAKRADSMSANPLTSLGYKLYRTFRFLSEHETAPVQQQSLNVVA